MKVALASEMQEIDRLAQAEFRLSGDLLMEKAALAAVELIEQDFKPLAGKTVYVVCGKGNNGGDGLALTRLLVERKVKATAVLAYDATAYVGLAGENLARAERYGAAVCRWADFDYGLLQNADLIVDALLGTGSKGAPRETVAEIIDKVNEARRPVYALDLPSGIDADNGQVPAMAVKAVKTVTFGLPQPGILVYPGAEFVGAVTVASLGFPRTLLEQERLRTNYLTAAEAASWLPQRSPTAHKGTGGHLLVVGGAPGLTGALTLAALGALRTGCGLVTAALAAPAEWPEKPLEVMATSWDSLRLDAGTYRGVVIGPGMTTGAAAKQLLLRLLHQRELPLVLDADALNIIAGERELLTGLTKPVVLTPHPGEMARLTGRSVAAVQADRLALAARLAAESGTVVVLKGARTVIAAPDGRRYINLTGNSGMATAGMGDLLAGMIGSLICQGLPAFEAGVLGTYLHGRAGDLAAAKSGPAGMVASDLLRQIPWALGRIGTETADGGGSRLLMTAPVS